MFYFCFVLILEVVFLSEKYKIVGFFKDLKEIICGLKCGGKILLFFIKM